MSAVNVTGLGGYHGSAADRGAADSYYGRPKDPHYYPNGTYQGQWVGVSEMTQSEIDAYNQAYDENEKLGDHKDWG